MVLVFFLYFNRRKGKWQYLDAKCAGQPLKSKAFWTFYVASGWNPYHNDRPAHKARGVCESKNVCFAK